MSTFDSAKTLLSDLLSKVVKGKLQLPDFQRGWVWDDEHIQSLLVKRHYYSDIEKALQGGPESLGDAIVAVDEQRPQRENFGREVTLDLTSREKDIERFHFPCSQILNSDDWEQALSVRAREARAVHEVPKAGGRAVP